jgi:hypothetical protein
MASEAPTQPRASRTSDGRVYLVSALVHAAIICVPLAVLVLSELPPRTPDANLGAGMGLLRTAVLGLPWSFIYFAVSGGNDPIIPELPDIGEAALFACFAILNLMIHLGYGLRQTRNRRPGLKETSAQAEESAQTRAMWRCGPGRGQSLPEK